MNKIFTTFSHAITLAPHMPTICEGVRTLSSPDEVKWAAIAMKGVCRLLSADINKVFWHRVLKLIDDGVFDGEDLPAKRRSVASLVKVLTYVNIYPDLFLEDHSNITKVINQFDGCIDFLRPFQLKALASTVMVIRGPASIWKQVDSKIYNLLTSVLEDSEETLEPLGEEHVPKSVIPVLEVRNIF